MLKTPVVLIIFNRPENTQKVFDIIRKVEPRKLLVIADGPRLNNTSDIEQCKRAREIIEQVDWDCEVIKHYSDHNLGCGLNVSSGLDWAFSNAEELIILEDDCVPDSTFLRFCEELLEKYRNDRRIMAISGQDYLDGMKSKHPDSSSYYFSRFNHCWGWASWRRAWQYNDYTMSSWPEAQSKGLLIDILGNSREVKFWSRVYQDCYDKKCEAWDYPWMFACWMQSGLAIIPSTNLVSNIGFGTDSTNTKDEGSALSNRKTTPMEFPLKHTHFVVRDARADKIIQQYIYVPIIDQLKIRVKALLGM